MNRLLQKLLIRSRQWFPDLGDDEQLNRYFSKGAIGTMSLQLALMAASFVTSFILARYLGKEDYGHYAYIITWFGLLTTTGSLGFDDLLVKEIPRYQQDHQWNKLRGVIRFAFWGSILGNILLAFIFLGYIQITPEPAIQVNRPYFYWMLLALPAYATSFVFMASLQANRMVIAAQWPDRLGRPLLFVVGLLLLFILPHVTDRLGAVIQLLTGSYILLFGFYGLYYWRRMGITIPRLGKRHYELKEWSKHLLFFFLLPLLNYLSKRIDFLLLGNMGFIEDLGIYNVASKLTDLITFPVVILNFVVSPFYSRYYHSGQLDKLQELLTKAIRLVFVLALPIFALLILAGYWLLGLWGPGFSAGYASLLFLSFAQLFYVFVGPVLYVLMMCGFGRDTFIALFIILLATTLLEWILIPFLGMNGAAIGRMVCMVLGHVYYGYLLYRKLGLYPSALGKLRKPRQHD